MNTATAIPARLLSATPAPELDVPLARGGRWRLSEQRPEKFTLVVVFRGFHCSFCKPEVEKLQTKLPEFSAIGIAVLAVSMDSEDHAASALDEWAISDQPHHRNPDVAACEISWSRPHRAGLVHQLFRYRSYWSLVARGTYRMGQCPARYRWRMAQVQRRQGAAR